jgi:hypothetical protein
VHDGVTDGTEVATFKGGATAGHVSLDLDGKLYVEGNSAGLTSGLGFNASAAKAEAGHWIGVPRTASVFNSWAGGLTVASAAYVLDAGGKAVLGPTTTIDGQSVIPLSQSTKLEGLSLEQTDYLAASGPPLPVEIIQNYDGLLLTFVYGKWGKAPDAAVHKGAVAFVKTWVGKS